MRCEFSFPRNIATINRLSADPLPGPDIAHSINLDEFILEKIAARALGIKKFDTDFFREQVEVIEVEPDETMEFHFIDGRRKTCKYEKSQ